jgi:hypothetical protein
MSGSADKYMAAPSRVAKPSLVASAARAQRVPTARRSLQRGSVELVFAMMEQDYATRSSPEHVDGWLGLMVGNLLEDGRSCHCRSWAIHGASAVHLPLPQQPSQSQQQRIRFSSLCSHSGHLYAVSASRSAARPPHRPSHSNNYVCPGHHLVQSQGFAHPLSVLFNCKRDHITSKATILKCL